MKALMKGVEKMILLQNLSYIVLFLGGFILGYRLFKNLRIPAEILFCALAIVSFYIGRSSFLLKIAEFELMLSYSLASFSSAYLPEACAAGFHCLKQRPERMHT